MDDLIRVKQIKFDSYSGEVEWTEKDYKEALHFIQTLYREQALSRSSDFESKVAELESNDAQRAVLGCYGIRETEIAAGIAKELMLRDGGRLVENIDWKLKWVTGSSKFAALREPLLQVDLHCFPTDKNRGRVNFEMTVDAVDTLIKELENAKSEFKVSN